MKKGGLVCGLRTAVERSGGLSHVHPACWTCRRQFLTRGVGLREHWEEMGHEHREHGKFVSGGNLEQWGGLMKMLLEGLAGYMG